MDNLDNLAAARHRQRELNARRCRLELTLAESQELDHLDDMLA